MRSVTYILFALCLSVPTASALAQQAGSALNNELQIKGIDQLNASIQRIEQRLGQFANIQWEYRFVQRNRLHNTEDILAQLGVEGWELVSVTTEEGYILKRAILPR